MISYSYSTTFSSQQDYLFIFTVINIGHVRKGATYVGYEIIHVTRNSKLFWNLEPCTITY